MKFITLGPQGSNHEFVTRRYIEHHGIAGRASLDFIQDFEQGVRAVLCHEADYLVQCAVHPTVMATVAQGFRGLYVMDTFISPSQNLAVLRRKDSPNATTLAVMRPTLDYVDAAKWQHIELVDTVAGVTQGLIEGKHRVGLAYASAAAAHPDLLMIDEFIGTVDDAWIVYGRTRVANERIIAWRDGPAGRQYRSEH